MNAQILLGQNGTSKVTTKDGTDYLVVGLSDIDKYRCRDLNNPGRYVLVPKEEVIIVQTESKPLPIRVPVY